MALHWASAIASATGAAITVAHVVEPTDQGDLIGGDAFANGAPDRWFEALDTAGIEHDFRSLHGDPPTEILDLSAEVGADMILLGRRERSLFAPRLLGSFTRQVLQVNEIPVAVVPAPDEQAAQTDRVPTVVVGLDGTASSQSVLTFATHIGDALDLDIQALSVIDIHADPVPMDQRSGQLLGSAARAQRQLVDAVDPQRRYRIAAQVEFGVPSDEILRHSIQAEVLVVGHRRTTLTGRFLKHATGRYCAAHAACPVVLVPIEPAVDHSRRRSTDPNAVL
jgi:nucleotide-binding universal stress UspA family protein